MNGVLVALTGWAVEPWTERFRRLLPDRPVHALGEDFDPDAIGYAVSWKHPAGSLARLPNLQAIFSLGAGVDHLFADPELPAGVALVRAVDPDLAQRMSEYVVLHCLLHLRQQRLYDRQQRERLWRDDRHQPAARDLRVGILGLGVLGQDAARKLQAIGFAVAGWNRTPRPLEGLPTFSGNGELPAFLARTDILVVLLPLTPETRGILARPLFEGLARDGRLGAPAVINAGRGGLQVEADLLSCLDDGTLGSATLDVFEEEPLPQASALWGHPPVTITPHNAAISDPDAIGKLIAGHIAAHERGEPLRDLVDRRRGY